MAETDAINQLNLMQQQIWDATHAQIMPAPAEKMTIT